MRSPLIPNGPVLGLAAVWFFAACSREAEDSPGPPQGSSGPVDVTVYETQSRLFVDNVVAVGTLRADESIDVSSNVTERIEEILFEDGQRVEEGDTLVRLVTQQEEAMLVSAKASLDEELREVERLRQLVGKGAAADIDLAGRETQQVLAEAKIGEMEAELADRRIVAPFTGNVGLRRISPGALVEPGSVITTLDKTDTMKLDFTVPETFLATLETGLTVAARSTAFPDQPFQGTIATIDSRVDPITRSVAVRALIPNDHGLLRPGMLMTVNLERSPRQSVAVPERAIIPIRDERAVFKVVDGKAIRTPVTTGRRLPGIVEILDGLSPSDTIITDGVLGLQDGAEVNAAGTFDSPVEPFDPKAGQES
ncbi:efflux RND transporter periplasmic adaptor subunit [soil metagenome]